MTEVEWLACADPLPMLDWVRVRGVCRPAPQARADVRRALRHWRQDVDLAGVRDPAALARLPEAGRADWQRPWADVAALVRQAGAGGTQ
jgi:hypothetical protein